MCKNPLIKRYFKIGLYIALVIISFIFIELLSVEKEQQIDIENANIFLEEVKLNSNIDIDNIKFNDSKTYSSTYSEKFSKYVPFVKNKFSTNQYNYENHFIISSLIFSVLFLIITYNDERKPLCSNFILTLPFKREDRYFYKMTCGLINLTLIYGFIALTKYFYYYKYNDIVNTLVYELGINKPDYYDMFNAKYISYFFLLSILIFVVFQFIANIFGNMEAGTIISILGLFGTVAIVNGALLLCEDYKIIKDKSIFDELNKVFVFLNEWYMLILFIFIFSVLSYIANKKIKSENNGKLFLFNWVKISVFVGVFLSGGFALYFVAPEMNIYINTNILLTIVSFICAGTICTMIFKKVFKFYM